VAGVHVLDDLAVLDRERLREKRDADVHQQRADERFRIVADLEPLGVRARCDRLDHRATPEELDVVLPDLRGDRQGAREREAERRHHDRLDPEPDDYVVDGGVGAAAAVQGGVADFQDPRGERGILAERLDDVLDLDRVATAQVQHFEDHRWQARELLHAGEIGSRTDRGGRFHSSL
jgi:hypothetical protein